MNSESDAHSVHFAHYAAKFERHLRNNGISCHDADLIIEESSVLYFSRLKGGENRIVRFIKKQEPAQMFVESACKAIKKLLPGAQDTFGSYSEIERCIH